jgi:hypothetical protein
MTLGVGCDCLLRVSGAHACVNYPVFPEVLGSVVTVLLGPKHLSFSSP